MDDPRWMMILDGWIDAWINRGNALDSLGNYEQSIECVDKVLQLDPNDVSALYNKGNELRKLEQYTKALECYDKVIDIDPKYVDAWTNKDVVHRLLKNEGHSDGS
jgi:tetratricopeptide (TPR) repeat protein